MFDGEPVIMADDSAIIRSNPRYRRCLIIYHVAEIEKLSLLARSFVGTVNHYFNYDTARIRRVNNKYIIFHCNFNITNSRTYRYTLMQ